MRLTTRSNGFKPRTGCFSLPQRKIRYVLQNHSGRFLRDLGSAQEGTHDQWVEDPNDAIQWAAEDSARAKLHNLQGRLRWVAVVEVEFILNQHGTYDWLMETFVA